MNIINLIPTSLLALFLASCTEIIDISTNAAEPQLVVEATIALNETATVFLSKTVGLNEPNNFEMVGGATVRITDNTGKTELLTEMSKGFYSSNALKGEVGKTYSLVITSGTQTVTSECKIPSLVPIDSFTVVNSIYPGGGPPRGNQPAPFYEIKLKYTDPADQQNFYRVVMYYNGKVQTRNSIFDDRFNNGKQIESSVILFNDSAKAGDKIRVELQCIDKNVHNYFASTGSAGGPPGASSSPANPYTNLNGAILGYFSAHTVERKEYVLKD
jgi:hypothetical protein